MLEQGWCEKCLWEIVARARHTGPDTVYSHFMRSSNPSTARRTQEPLLLYQFHGLLLADENRPTMLQFAQKYG